MAQPQAREGKLAYVFKGTVLVKHHTRRDVILWLEVWFAFA